MNTQKETYETPASKTIEVKIEGSIMDLTALEPIEPGDEHDW